MFRKLERIDLTQVFQNMNIVCNFVKMKAL